jgi:hypothetical protein
MRWPTISVIFCARWRGRPQFGDQTQNLGEQISRNRDLGHPKGDIAAVAHDLRADLDQLLFQARQRPSLIGSGVGSCTDLKRSIVLCSIKNQGRGASL